MSLLLHLTGDRRDIGLMLDSFRPSRLRGCQAALTLGIAGQIGGRSELDPLRLERREGFTGPLADPAPLGSEKLAII